METLTNSTSAFPETEPELHLLLERDRRWDWRRWRVAAVVSVAVHLILLVALVLMPESETRTYEEPEPKLEITHLYTPTDLTQKAPNKGKVSKQVTVEAIAPHPVVKNPGPVPAPKQAVAPPPQVARTEARPVFVEPPKIEAPQTQLESQSDQLAKLNAPPPPPPSAQPPKIVFESAVAPPPAGGNQGKPGGLIPRPDTSVAASIHDLSASPGTISGHQAVGDIGTDLGSAGAGLNLPPSAGRPHSNLELRSDPMGVDFRPYLIQVLAAVRRNWFAVYPQAAKMGMRGEVALEFAIAKQGGVTKVVYSAQTGSKPLDEAAVAAISASNPLPPLPKDFKGDRIILRLTFMYNMQR